MQANTQCAVNKGAGTWTDTLSLGRRTWFIIAASILVAGAALNWSWLVAVGIAPLLLSLAPCAAMCALGLCMKMGPGGCKQSDGAEAAMAPVPVRHRNPGQP